jgi:hypothetical protein
LETVEQEPDNGDAESPVGLTIGSLVCSGIAVILLFASCVPDFGEGGAAWMWLGLALTILVAALAAMVLKSGLSLTYKLIVALGAAVPVALYAYYFACIVFSSG